MVMTYEQALTYIHSRIHLGSRKGLSRIALLLKKLGHPERRMEFVHIAGSNGKGSTAVMMESVLRAAGYSTGLFVSPFVMDFRERIQLNGRLISKENLCKGLESMLPALNEMKALGQECTEFETVTALALVCFVQAGVEYAVFEVGIGGLLDCTNVIPAPAVAVLTAVSLEHTEILGSTISEIAWQKCGILKPGCRAAGYCALEPQAEDVLRQSCQRMGIPLTVADLSRIEIFREEEDGSEFRYQGQNWKIALVGRHQIYNALTVLSAVEQLRLGGVVLPEEVVRMGLDRAEIVGRFQLVRKSPRCILDGAHNPGKIAALCQTLEEVYPGRQIYTVMGMMARKDWKSCVPQLARRSKAFFAVPVQGEGQAALPEALADLASQSCGQVQVCESPQAGVLAALALAGPEDVIVACGSMYLLDRAKSGFLDSN